MNKFLALGDTPTTIYTSSDSDGVSVRESPPQIYDSFDLETDDDLSDQETLTPFQEDVSEFIQRYPIYKGFRLSDAEKERQKSEDFMSLLIEAVCTKSVAKLFWIPMGSCTPSEEEESEFATELYDLSSLVRDCCPMDNYKFVSFLLLAKSLENLYPTELSTDFIVKATSLYPKLEKPGSVENLISSIISKFKPLSKDPGALIKALTLLYQTELS